MELHASCLSADVGNMKLWGGTHLTYLRQVINRLLRQCGTFLSKGDFRKMTEQKAMAYVNMYGILGALEDLCRIDVEAAELVKQIKKPVSMCFCVKNGPCRTFHFTNEGCRITEGSDGCNCKMNFKSVESFNTFINEAKPGMPAKGAVRLFSFLLGTFSKLTDRLEAVLKPSEQDLADPEFFKENTILTLYVVGGAVCGLANSDSIAKISASNTPDGDVSLGIKDEAELTIRIKNSVFTLIKQPAENPRAVMEFSDIALANGLFAGTVSTVNEMCKGNIRLAGVLSMVDNINRILDRVNIYLGGN